jgi:nitrate reductase beta subunit
VVGQLGRRPRRLARSTPPSDVMLKGIEDKVKFEFEQTFMFYLPRICEHCLNPSCAASCPSGAIYKREEDGIVLVDQDRCRGWRMCVSGCPYKKVYFNHKTGKAEKCTFCYPRIEVGIPTVCSETCVGRLRYIGLVLYDADKVLEAASTETNTTCTRRSSVFLDPVDPEVAREAEKAGIPVTGSRPPRSRPVYQADHRLQGGAAAAPGVPHHADGLVHPAAVAGGRRDQGHRPRRRGPATSSPRSRRCASPSSTSPTCSPPAMSEPVNNVLRKLAAMRSYMRDINLGRDRDPSIPEAVGMTEESMYEMFRLLAIAKYAERYVIPTAHAEQAHAWRSWPPTAPSRRTAATSESFGEGSGAPTPVAVENFRMLRSARPPTRIAAAADNPLAGQPAQLGRPGMPEGLFPPKADVPDGCGDRGPEPPAASREMAAASRERSKPKIGVEERRRIWQACSAAARLPQRRTGRRCSARSRACPCPRGRPRGPRRALPPYAAGRPATRLRRDLRPHPQVRALSHLLHLRRHPSRGVALVEFKQAYRKAGLESRPRASCPTTCAPYSSSAPPSTPTVPGSCSTTTARASRCCAWRCWRNDDSYDLAARGRTR